MSLLGRCSIVFFGALVCVAHAEPFGPYVERFGGNYGSSYGGGMSSSQYYNQQAQIARENAQRADERRRMEAQVARENAQRADERRRMETQIARENAQRADERRRMDAQIARDNQQRLEQARLYPSAPSPQFYPPPSYRNVEPLQQFEISQFAPPRTRPSTPNRTAEELPPPPPVKIPQSLIAKGWQSPGDQFGRTTNYDGQAIYPNSVAWRVNKEGRVEQLTARSPEFLRAQALEVEQGYAQIKTQLSQVTSGWKPGVGVSIPPIASEAQLEQWWKENGEAFGRMVEKSLLANGEPPLNCIAQAATESLREKYVRELNLRTQLMQAVAELESHALGATQAIEASLSQSAAKSFPVEQARREGQRVLDEQGKAWEAKLSRLGELVAQAKSLPLGLAIGKTPEIEAWASEQKQRLAPLVNLRKPLIANQVRNSQREVLVRDMQTPKWLGEQVVRLDALIHSKFESGDFVSHIRGPLLKSLEQHAQSRASAVSALESMLGAQRERAGALWSGIEKQFLSLATPIDPAKLTELAAQAKAAAESSLREGEAWDAAQREELERRNLFADIEKQFQSLYDSNSLVITPINNAPDYRLEFDIKRRAYLAYGVKAVEGTRWERLMEIRKPRHFVQNESWAAMIAEQIPDKPTNPQGWLVLLHEGKVVSVVEPLNPHTEHWQLVAQGTKGFRVELKDKKSGLPLQEFALELGLDGQLVPAPGSAESLSVRPAWDALPLSP